MKTFDFLSELREVSFNDPTVRAMLFAHDPMVSPNELMVNIIKTLVEQKKDILNRLIATESMKAPPSIILSREQYTAATGHKFVIGDKVKKTKGSEWHGTVVGTYSTELTNEGYAVESKFEKGSVQIYPAGALELEIPLQQG